MPYLSESSHVCQLVIVGDKNPTRTMTDTKFKENPFFNSKDRERKARMCFLKQAFTLQYK